jgi:hypothetical protein
MNSIKSLFPVFMKGVVEGMEVGKEIVSNE